MITKEERKEISIRNGKKQCGKLPINSKYKVGMKIGNLLILERLTPIGFITHNPVWKCKCDCGNIINVTSQKFSSKWFKRHCGCLDNHRKNWKGYEDISGYQWCIIKRNAIRRNIIFNITIKEVWDLYIKQNKKCALSGLDISFKDKTASIDRIDSSKGYTIDNIQIVEKNINIMKRNFSLEYFYYLCKNVVNNTLINNNKIKKE